MTSLAQVMDAAAGGFCRDTRATRQNADIGAALNHRFYESF